MHGISRRGINHLFYEITKYCKLLDSFIVYDIILLAVIDIDINTNDMLNLFYFTLAIIQVFQGTSFSFNAFCTFLKAVAS